MTMWHLLSDGKPWFLPKRFGYGAGTPIAWQGWVLLLSFTAALLGLALLAARARGYALAGTIALIVLLTAILVLVAKARTRGEWRWRWGEDD
jgi:hypothetical protein